MPIVECGMNELFAKIGRQFTEPEFKKVCFQFGIELDDVTSEAKKAESSGAKVAAPLSNEVLYRVEVPANRYDVLCVEGLALALRIFLGIDGQKPPRYQYVAGKERLRITNHTKQTGPVRQFVVGAVLRDFKMTPQTYQSLMSLQEILHKNICRRRTLVAIGTHDLDTIQGPFSYEALPFDQIKFVPLGEHKNMNVSELFHYLEFEKENSHLKPYLPITKDSPVHPVIYDKNRTVLSLPPIINGEHSKITLKTKNILIECTGTDWTKTQIVLNTMVAMFSGYCAKPYTVEQVEIVDESKGQDPVLTPNMTETMFDVSTSYINKRIGTSLDVEAVRELVEKMGMRASHSSDDPGNGLLVSVPVTRSDIMHPCDIAEDVAIAYGYNTIIPSMPKAATVGREQPINKLSDQIREAFSQSGYLEVLTWVLTNEEENFDNMKIPRPDKNQYVSVSNPATVDFTMLRTSLLPGLLKVIHENNGVYKLPMRVFEVSDVVHVDKSTTTGARNVRKAVGMFAGLTTGFEEIHALLDRLMSVLDVVWVSDQVLKSREESKKDGKKDAKKGKGGKEESKTPTKREYHLVPSSDPAFIRGQGATVVLSDKPVGKMGILNPDVPAGFKIDNIVISAFEFDLEPFL